MHHDFLDRFSRLDSSVHRLPTLAKVIISLCVVAVVVVSPITKVYIFILVAIFLLFVVVRSKVPAGFIVKRILILEPFVLLVAAMTVFQEEGGVKFASIVIKSSLSLLVVILFSNTTPFSSLLQMLRRLRIPSVFITVLALMYRYIFVLIDEVERMNRARKSRTFSNESGHRWRILSMLVGQLFVRSTERAERIYAAMSARGWR